MVDRAGSEAFLWLESVPKFGRVRIFTDSLLLSLHSCEMAPPQLEA
jgi:hypothetical protein